MNTRTASWIAVAGLLLVASAGRTARGDDAPTPSPARTAPTPDAPTAPPEAGGGAPPSTVPGATPAAGLLALTLADALRYGAARNLELAAGAYDPAIAGDSLQAAWGSFDTLLTAALAGGHAETPSNSIFTGAGVTNENSFAADATASRRMKNGGTLALIFHADRLFTTSGTSNVNPRWQQGAAVEWTQPLLRGAGDVAMVEVRRAQNGIRVADHGLAALTDGVLLRIETAYWDLAFLTEQVLARRKSEDVARNLVDLTGARLDAKVATPIDLAEARAGLESRTGDRILAQGLRDRAEDELRVLILPFDREGGRGIRLSAVDDPRVVPPGERLPDTDEARYVAMALRRRPDLLATEAELESFELDVRTASNDLRPQLDLVVRLGTDGLDGSFGSALEETGSGQALSASVGVSFSLYLGRRTARARLRMAQWTQRQAEVVRRDLENRIVADVRGALRDLVTSRARMTAAAAEIQAAGESLGGERVKEKNGESTPFRVLEREEVVTQAVTREGRAAADVRIALARLWKSIGMLAEVRGVKPPTAGAGER